MGKLKFMILKEKQMAIVKDALRAYVALRAEDYHNNPSKPASEILHDAVETLELFTKPHKQKSEIQRRVERIKS
jgi:hypothetical protein